MLNYKEIKETIEKLLPLLEKYNNGDISYQIDQLKRIYDKLVVGNNALDKEEIMKIIQNIYPPRGGLTDFNVWVEDGQQRIAINKPIDDLNDRLWNLTMNND